MLATNNQSLKEWAYNYGREVPEQSWLLHDCDIWLANPHYKGPNAPHPDSYVDPSEIECPEREFDDVELDDIPY